MPVTILTCFLSRPSVATVCLHTESPLGAKDITANEVDSPDFDVTGIFLFSRHMMGHLHCSFCPKFLCQIANEDKIVSVVLTLIGKSKRFPKPSSAPFCADTKTRCAPPRTKPIPSTLDWAAPHLEALRPSWPLILISS